MIILLIILLILSIVNLFQGNERGAFQCLVLANFSLTFIFLNRIVEILNK